jgi:DNA-directed RNA polymerase subunit K/omega
MILDEFPEEEEYEEEEEETGREVLEDVSKYPKNFPRITVYPEEFKLTSYERAKVLQKRVDQLARGLPALIPVDPKTKSLYEIAKKELEERKIPLQVVRRHPGNVVEILKLYKE